MMKPKRFSFLKSVLMNVIPPRVVIYSKDVSNITGLSPKASRKLLCNIRKLLGKPGRSFVTVKEFTSYTGINEEQVRPFLL
jgi:hypothetical protein